MCIYIYASALKKSIKGLKKNYGKWLLVGLRWEKTEI